MASDPLSDAVDALIRAGLDPERCQRVIAEVRHRWVGHCYIKAVDREARNAEIQAALQAGGTPEAVAKQVGTSSATIRRIRRQWL